MEILNGVHQIAVNYRGRPLKLYLLGFNGESLLMDTGDAGVPGSDILPYFGKVGFKAEGLNHIMITHPDVDHTGGMRRMREAAPGVKFYCGTQDREQIETPEGLADIRGRAHYYWHGIGPDDAARAAFIERDGGAGTRFVMERTFDGGETFLLGGKELQIMHLPGHSHGHLGVYLPWEKTAIIADAVHHTANRFLDGRAAFAVTYMYIDEYLGTIDRLEAMGLERLYSCHWPDCVGAEAVRTFLRESRDYALRAEQAILETVRGAGEKGMTLREVCVAAKPKLGDWPAERDMDTRSMACGHLQRLADRGLVRAFGEERPVRYFYEARWRGLR